MLHNSLKITELCCPSQFPALHIGVKIFIFLLTVDLLILIVCVLKILVDFQSYEREIFMKEVKKSVKVTFTCWIFLD